MEFSRDFLKIQVLCALCQIKLPYRPFTSAAKQGLKQFDAWLWRKLVHLLRLKIFLWHPAPLRGQNHSHKTTTNKKRNRINEITYTHDRVLNGPTQPSFFGFGLGHELSQILSFLLSWNLPFPSGVLFEMGEGAVSFAIVQ